MDPVAQLPARDAKLIGPEAYSINHIALVLDAMGVDNAEDFKYTEEESKQQSGSVVSSNDVFVPHNTSLTASWAHSVDQPSIRCSIANYDIRKSVMAHCNLSISRQ